VGDWNDEASPPVAYFTFGMTLFAIGVTIVGPKKEVPAPVLCGRSRDHHYDRGSYDNGTTDDYDFDHCKAQGRGEGSARYGYVHRSEANDHDNRGTEDSA
jgi:hypothetical protein